MRVILLQDIEKVGKKFEVVEVADGYARNFLIPKKLAEPVTKESLARVKIFKEEEAKKAEEELAKIQELATALDDQEIEIKEKVKEDGQLFGSINEANIIQALAEQGLNIKKKWIKLERPIKEIGEYDILLELEHGLEAKIKLIVTEEADKSEEKLSDE